MSTRLQVVLEESELREIRRAARRERVTLSEWVRRTLREARQQQPSGDAERKVQAVRAAARHSFPSADIEVMLGEIEKGQGSGLP